MKRFVVIIKWGAMWRSENKLDGVTRHIICNDLFPAMFYTREQVRKYIKVRYGYIAKRKDLQREPHGWQMPIPVRLKIAVKGARR